MKTLIENLKDCVGQESACEIVMLGYVVAITAHGAWIMTTGG